MASSTEEDVPTTCWGAVIGATLEYDTPKIVHIKSWKVGLVNRILQLAVIGYIIGYVIVYQKGYQDTADAVGMVTTKLKGVAYAGVPQSGIAPRIWDSADYVVPPQENSAFFVMTNMIITQDQTNTVCAEDPSMKGVTCTEDSDCPAMVAVTNGNGVRTGKCVLYDNSTNTCEIYAWCPVENDNLNGSETAVLTAAANFTVLIKNAISFNKFNIQRRNILDDVDTEYLKNCTYNSKEILDKYCPIFVLGDIVEEATGKPMSDMASLGGVIGIEIRWDCNLDWSLSYCVPRYIFTREDRADALIAPGFNFRYADHYKENDINYRTLVKAYGIMFKISITGTGGKFDIIPLILNLASGLALLVLSTVACDLIILYVHKKRHYFREKKYLNVNNADGSLIDFSPLQSKPRSDSERQRIIAN